MKFVITSFNKLPAESWSVTDAIYSLEGRKRYFVEGDELVHSTRPQQFGRPGASWGSSVRIKTEY